MKNYFAFRRIEEEDIQPAATSIRLEGRWYMVLGYDPQDDTFTIEDWTTNGRAVDAADIHHSDIRVEAGIRTLNEVLDLFN